MMPVNLTMLFNELLDQFFRSCYQSYIAALIMVVVTVPLTVLVLVNYELQLVLKAKKVVILYMTLT